VLISKAARKEILSSLVNLNEALTMHQRSNALVPYQKRISLATSRYFHKQSIALQRSIALVGIAYAVNAFDTAKSDVSIKKVLDAIVLAYLAGMVFSNREYQLGLLGNLLTLKNARVLGYGASTALRLPGQLDATTRNDIARIVGQQGTASDLRRLFVSYQTNRANLIGSHEASSAYQSGSYGAILEATTTGLGFEKKWLTANDDRVDAECLANGDEDFIPFGSPHQSGDQYPPQHPNCRCFEVYRRL
jgi:hypothetical protein